MYEFTPTGAGYGMFYGEIEYLDDGTWSVPKYEPSPLTAEVAGNEWLIALIVLAKPIIEDRLKKAIVAAIKAALSNIRYTIGPLTFSSDGTNITVSYKLPLTEEAIGMYIKLCAVV